MSAIEWITAFLQSMMSPLLTWPATGLVIWAMFSWRIGRVHHVRNEDIPERAEEIKA